MCTVLVTRNYNQLSYLKHNEDGIVVTEYIILLEFYFLEDVSTLAGVNLQEKYNDDAIEWEQTYLLTCIPECLLFCDLHPALLTLSTTAR